ncbi:MAG: adenylate cyclase [Solirubrobacteraceae bacterium]|nr:adenylate cyclase [Solirubrobacteraceae bacterium]
MRALLLAAICVVVGGVAVTAFATNVLRATELQSVDARFEIRGRHAQPRDVVVVAIDTRTFEQLRKQWPFPRSVHAQAIDRLRRAGARVIAYDVQFSEPSQDPAEDNRLVDAVSHTHNVVLSTTEADSQGEPNVFGGGGILREIGARAGNTVLPPDPSGVIRRIPYAAGLLPSFAVVAAGAFDGTRVPFTSPRTDTHWIDYVGPPGTVRTVSFSDVVRGTFPPGVFRGKIVVVGASVPTLQDVHPTPTSGNELMSGPEIQANAILTARRGFPLSPAPKWVGILLVALASLLVPLAALRLSAGPIVLLAVAAMAGLCAACQLAFNAGTILPFVYPAGAVVLSSGGALAVDAVTNAFERERIRDLFSRFVPEQVVDAVVSQAEGLRLESVEVDGTVLFSDLRGFTTYSEAHPAKQVIEVLNRYLTEMSEAIMENGGTLISYMGDGIMAIFGAPIEQPDHADRGVATARSMAGERLDRFNEWMRENGYGDGFQMGVGVNTGRIMVGNIGSERRLDYTAIGDVTNTASRLEGMTKGTPHSVFVGAETRARMTGDTDGLMVIGEQPVRGRTASITIFSIPE